MREGQHITLLSGPANGDPTGQGGVYMASYRTYGETLDWPLESLSSVTVLWPGVKPMTLAMMLAM